MKKTHIPKILLQLVLISFAAIQLYPLVFLFFFSLKDNNEIYGGNVMGLPRQFKWSNYENALFNANVGNYLLNSIFVTLVVILVSGVLACMVSYAIARMTVKINGIVKIFFFTGTDDSPPCSASACIHYVEKYENAGYLSGHYHSLYCLCAAYGDFLYDWFFPDIAQRTGRIGIFGWVQYLQDILFDYASTGKAGTGYDFCFYISVHVE